MPNDVKLNHPANTAEPARSLATTTIGEVGSPPAPGPAPGCASAVSCKAPESCRECLAAVAHRLAQPMTALRGGIELGLMGKRSAADYRFLLEQSLQLADNMAQLIISLRDLGESGAPGAPPSTSSWKGRPRKSWQKWRAWRNPGSSVCNSRQKGK